MINHELHNAELQIENNGFTQRSVSNGSKLAVQFRAWVGLELEMLQQVSSHQKTDQHQSRGFLAGPIFLPT
jgi:hypothetical protein